MSLPSVTISTLLSVLPSAAVCDDVASHLPGFCFEKS